MLIINGIPISYRTIKDGESIFAQHHAHTNLEYPVECDVYKHFNPYDNFPPYPWCIDEAIHDLAKPIVNKLWEMWCDNNGEYIYKTSIL